MEAKVTGDLGMNDIYTKRWISRDRVITLLAADYPPCKRIHLEKLTDSQLAEIASERFNTSIGISDEKTT